MSRRPEEFTPPFLRSQALSFDSEHLLRSENIPFDIDNWYPALKRWTFETEFLPLSRPEARAIVRVYRSRFLHRGGLRPEDPGTLGGLEERLDKLVRRRFSGAGCFVRLCGRSVKDAEPLDRAEVLRQYEAALRREAPGSDFADREGIPAELRMRAAAQVGTLRARTGAEVMNLLLSSERVYADMLDWVWFGEPEQVVLRRWEPEVSVDFEFRLYVHENRLTAISQYDHHCYYEHLHALKGRLLPRMAGLWHEVHPHVGVASYCLDMAYLPESDGLLVVELSPFLRCTGAHCFRWGKAEDADVLEGRAPFQFRLVDQPTPDFGDMFCSGWEQRWCCGEELPAFWELYQTQAQRFRFEQWLRLHRVLPEPLVFAVGQAALSLAMLAASGRRSSARNKCVMACGAALSAAAVAAPLATALRRKMRVRHWAFLFVYGTLKRGMHWNAKFLSQGAEFVRVGVSVERFPLVVGRCGVPYLLFDRSGCGHRVRGELWRVDADCLEGLDQYEGLEKAYYSRPAIDVEAGGRVVRASVYVVNTSSPALQALPCLEEYGLERHRHSYKAVEHILLKQKIYLQGAQQYSRRGVVHPACSVEEDAEARPPAAIESVAPPLI